MKWVEPESHDICKDGGQIMFYIPLVVEKYLCFG